MALEKDLNRFLTSKERQKCGLATKQELIPAGWEIYA